MLRRGQGALLDAEASVWQRHTDASFFLWEGQRREAGSRLPCVCQHRALRMRSSVTQKRSARAGISVSPAARARSRASADTACCAAHCAACVEKDGALLGGVFDFGTVQKNAPGAAVRQVHGHRLDVRTVKRQTPLEEIYPFVVQPLIKVIQILHSFLFLPPSTALPWTAARPYPPASDFQIRAAWRR